MSTNFRTSQNANQFLCPLPLKIGRTMSLPLKTINFSFESSSFSFRKKKFFWGQTMENLSHSKKLLIEYRIMTVSLCLIRNEDENRSEAMQTEGTIDLNRLFYLQNSCRTWKLKRRILAEMRKRNLKIQDEEKKMVKNGIML